MRAADAEEKGKEVFGTDQIRVQRGEKLGLAPNSEPKILAFLNDGDYSP